MCHLFLLFTGFLTFFFFKFNIGNSLSGPNFVKFILENLLFGESEVTYPLENICFLKM